MKCTYSISSFGLFQMVQLVKDLLEITSAFPMSCTLSLTTARVKILAGAYEKVASDYVEFLKYW